MVARTVITVDAVFEGGLLRPLETLPFGPNKRVTLRIDVPEIDPIWPANTAEIYAELESDDRATAERMLAGIRETWPGGVAE